MPAAAGQLRGRLEALHHRVGFPPHMLLLLAGCLGPAWLRSMVQPAAGTLWPLSMPVIRTFRLSELDRC